METQSKQVLAHWFTRARIAQKTHLRTAEKLMRLNKKLGIPVVVLTTIVGTTVFASLGTNSQNSLIQILVGLTSISAATLASLQTFFNFSEKSEQHRIASNRFAKIKHDIVTAVIELETAPAEEFVSFVKQIQIEWDTTNESSPLPDQNIFKDVFKELGGDIHFSYILENEAKEPGQ
jgi:hypothetical protein